MSELFLFIMSIWIVSSILKNVRSLFKDTSAEIDLDRRVSRICTETARLRGEVSRLNALCDSYINRIDEEVQTKKDMVREIMHILSKYAGSELTNPQTTSSVTQLPSLPTGK